MTAYGGFSVLAKFFEKIELKAAVSGMIPFEERSPNGTGGHAKILRFGLTVIVGGRRFGHAAFLGDSVEVYEKLFGVDRLPTSTTAITRFFGRFRSWKTAERFADELWNYCGRVVIPWTEIGADHLTFDSTVITRHGKQEGVFVGYNSRCKGRPSHHPILAFLNRSKYLINLGNRSGNASSANGIVRFALQTIARIGGRLKILGCLADSGFCDIRFVSLLEVEQIEYVIAARRHGRIRVVLRGDFSSSPSSLAIDGNSPEIFSLFGFLKF